MEEVNKKRVASNFKDTQAQETLINHFRKDALERYHAALEKSSRLREFGGQVSDFFLPYLNKVSMMLNVKKLDQKEIFGS